MYYLLYLLILSLLYLLWRFLFSKLLKIRNRNFNSFLFSIFLSVPIFIITFFVIEHGYINKKSFNKNQWKQSTEGRNKMSDDLLEKKIVLRKNKSTVIALLGKPNRYAQDSQWVYDIGRNPKFLHLDESSIFITFKDNRVVSAIQYDD